jgi:hypothetical protein
MRKLGFLLALVASTTVWAQSEITTGIRDVVKRPEGPTARVLARYEPATVAAAKVPQKDAKGNVVVDERSQGRSLFIFEIPAAQFFDRYTLTPQILASGKSDQPLIYDSTGIELSASLPPPEALKSLDIGFTHYIPPKTSKNSSYELRGYAVAQRAKVELNAQPYVSGDWKTARTDSGVGVDLSADYRLERPFAAGLRSYVFADPKENKTIVGPSLNLKLEKVNAFVMGGYDFARGKDNLFARLQVLLEM